MPKRTPEPDYTMPDEKGGRRPMDARERYVADIVYRIPDSFRDAMAERGDDTGVL
jgi:hypothetical protein